MEPGGFTWHDAEAYAKRTRKLDLVDESANDFLYVDQILTATEHNELDYKAALQGAADFAPGNRVGNPGPYPMWRKGAVCASASKEYARAHAFDFTAHLQQYTPKVLFVYSELNEAYGKNWAVQVSSAYPHVQLEEIRGVGHEIVHFGWDKFYPIAKAYLNSFK
jgi:proline iminopeptidase